MPSNGWRKSSGKQKKGNRLKTIDQGQMSKSPELNGVQDPS
jgi:hypothetical protein